MILRGRADIARLSGADGVCLGPEDVPIADAMRILGPVAVVGAEARSVDEALALVIYDDGRIVVCIPGQVKISAFAWGMVLCDIARNAAAAYKGSLISDQSEYLTEIKRGFDAEWKDATSWPRRRK